MRKKSSTSFIRRFIAWRGSDYFVLAGGIGLLCALVLPTIATASIWFDEAFSAYITQFSFADIARYTANDVHPPLYYWILKAWESVFGSGSELALRSLSLVFTAVAAVFGFLLIRRLFGRKAAALGLLFLVLSPMVVRYSQEARMYTLETAIILAATYVMVRASEAKRWSLWIVYGLLVSLGMWTHYFTALAWIAHWIWRLISLRQTGAKGRDLATKLFTKQWIVAHIIAIATFIPWIPSMLYQLVVVQSGGFWIGPVGVDTPAAYLTNLFLYLEHGQVQGWIALALVVVVVAFVVLGRRVYTMLNPEKKRSYVLILALAVVPVLLLIVASMPPLRSAFVERYLIPSVMATMLLMGVIAAYGLAKYKPWKRVIAVVIVVALLATGIGNVYYYGNYNKNSNTNILTRQLIEKIHEVAQPGDPIIARDSWIFYEAVFYTTPEHPVYLIDEDEVYLYGSQDMIRYNDQHKILDMDSFLARHQTVWYIANTGDEHVTAERTKDWTLLNSVSAHDPIGNVDKYKGTEYRTSSAE